MSDDEKPVEVDRFAGSGDVMDGGFILYRRPDGSHFIEATGGIPDNVEHAPWLLLHVYRRDVPDDIWKEFDWAEPDAVMSFVDGDAADGTDPDPMTRAHLITNIGDYHGWRNIDDYPLTLSLHELRLRWENEDDDKGALEAADESLQGGDYGASEPMGALYNLIVKAEKEGWNMEGMVLEAFRLRRRALGTPPTYQSASGDAEFIAEDLANHLNTKTNDWWRPFRVLVHGPKLEAATVHFDKNKGSGAGSWVARKNDDKTEPETY